MESLTKMTAVPKEVEVGSQKEMLYPLRFMEWGCLEQWMRSTIIDAAKATIKDADRKEAIIVMRSANHAAAKISVMQCLRAGLDLDDTGSYLRSFEGMLRTLQLALRTSSAKDAKSKYTLSELDERLAGDITQLNLLFLDVMEASFPSVDIKLTDSEEDTATAKN